MIENHTHISSLRVLPISRPYGAPENTGAVATHITPLAGLWKTPGPLLPILRP